MSDLHRIVSYGRWREELDNLLVGGEDIFAKALWVILAITLAGGLVLAVVLRG